jgi:hypothetical protein
MASHDAAGTSAFTHDTDVKTGKAARAVHATLDPKLVAGPKSPYAGKVMRESRDSDAHPNSVAIGVLFDVTGSVGNGPRTFIKKLGPLMSLIVKKGYLADPQLLYGAIGDETSDDVPLQIGQFEAGNEQEESLSKIFIEGNGGGQHYESYELAMYFMSRHTSADCWEKRGKKGYLFIVGDELPREKIDRKAVERLIGDKLDENLSTAEVLEELREHYEVYWIFPNCSSYYTMTLTSEPLIQMFGQNFIRLENIEEIAEVVAATIGISEGFNPKDIVDDLIDAGLSKAGAKRATTALATIASTSVTKKSATVEGKLPKRGKDSAERL